MCPSQENNTATQWTWRRVDTCQFSTRVHVNIPRVECGLHGVIQIDTPWAEQNSRFNSLFECLVISWLKEASISVVSRRLNLSWNAVDGIMSRAVKQGLSRRKEPFVKNLAVDEVSSKKGHKYVTIVSDGRRVVMDILDDRKVGEHNMFKSSVLFHIGGLDLHPRMTPT